MNGTPKINWGDLSEREKSQVLGKYLFDGEYTRDFYFDFRICFETLEKKFPRGFRWRPDNKLLICYENYDNPPTQIDCDTFEDGAWVILLRLAGVEVNY